MLLTTQKDRLKYLRKVCKENGLVFKKDDNYWLSDKACYMIVDRETGEKVSSYYTIDSAYLNEMNTGFISSGYSENDVDYL